MGVVEEGVLRDVEKEQVDVDVTEGTARWASARPCTRQRRYALRAAKCDRMVAAGRVNSTPTQILVGRGGRGQKKRKKAMQTDCGGERVSSGGQESSTGAQSTVPGAASHICMAAGINWSSRSWTAPLERGEVARGERAPDRWSSVVDLWDGVQIGESFLAWFFCRAKLRRWVLPWRQPVTVARIGILCALYDTQHLRSTRPETLPLQN
jgi:hypothetical protein